MKLTISRQELTAARDLIRLKPQFDVLSDALQAILDGEKPTDDFPDAIIKVLNLGLWQSGDREGEPMLPELFFALKHAMNICIMIDHAQGYGFDFHAEDCEKSVEFPVLTEHGSMVKLLSS